MLTSTWHTTRKLTTAASLAKFLCPTKAVVRTFETAHNYADNTDTYTKVSQSPIASPEWPHPAAAHPTDGRPNQRIHAAFAGRFSFPFPLFFVLSSVFCLFVACSEYLHTPGERTYARAFVLPRITHVVEARRAGRGVRRTRRLFCRPRQALRATMCAPLLFEGASRSRSRPLRARAFR